MKRLDQLSVGETASVQRVVGMDEISLRLLEMGLTPGVDVTLVGIAPLGDPMEFELRSYRLSLRRREAAQVEIDAP